MADGVKIVKLAESIACAERRRGDAEERRG